MNTVTFGDKNSYTDFDLILSSKSIGWPEPQGESVEVTGHDGEIDLTLGDTVRYKNRALQFTFTLTQANTRWVEVMDALTAYLHGQKMKVILSEDSNYYFYGKLTINSFGCSQTLGTIVIDCDAQPYRTHITSGDAKL